MNWFFSVVVLLLFSASAFALSNNNFSSVNQVQPVLNNTVTLSQIAVRPVQLYTICKSNSSCASFYAGLDYVLNACIFKVVRVS